MYLLGHVGLTVAAWLLTGRRVLLVPLLLGAVLPDLVDKPLGLILGLGYGRLIAHTALAAAAVASMGLWWRSPVLVAVALGMAGHLAMDQLWLVPEVLLWPSLGPFPRGDWDAAKYVATVRDPYVIVTEVAGGVALAVAAWYAWQKRLIARRDMRPH